MKTLEEQVTSLELSKKLKELGVKQDSNFYWQYGLNKDAHYHEWYIVDDGHKYIDNQEGFSAFTVCELGKLLPNNVNLPYKVSGGWIWSNSERDVLSKNEATARAKLLIYLIENVKVLIK